MKRKLITTVVRAGLACTIGLTAFFSAGCKKTPDNADGTDNSDNPSIVDPNNPDSTNPNNPSTPTDPDYSNYSKLVQNILKSDYYKNLVNENYGPDMNSSPLFDPHPYAFLQTQGHDVDAIKRGDLECRTCSFIKETEPTNLYIITYVENASATPYYTEFMLKYNLTEEEAEDYDYLHGSNNGIALQSVFLNDEISRVKTPTIVSKTNMSVEAHKGMQEDVKKNNKVTKETLGTNFIDIMLKDYSVDNQTFDIFVYYPHDVTSSAKKASKIGVLNCRSGLSFVQCVDNVYTFPIDDYKIVSLESYKNSVENITVYSTQNLYLNVIGMYNMYAQSNDLEK